MIPRPEWGAGSCNPGPMILHTLVERSPSRLSHFTFGYTSYPTPVIHSFKTSNVKRHTAPSREKTKESVVDRRLVLLLLPLTKKTEGQIDSLKTRSRG